MLYSSVQFKVKFTLKGTFDVVSSDPQIKETHDRFATLS